MHGSPFQSLGSYVIKSGTLRVVLADSGADSFSSDALYLS